MGRHRPDPRGHARIFIAAAAVALAIALLVVGGVALWGALSSEPASPAPATSQADPPAATQTRSTGRSRQQASTVPGGAALVVRCRVARCGVFISSSPTNDVLFNGVMRQGEERRADEPRMNLVVSDSGGVDVYINGRLQPKGTAGKRKIYTIIKS
ncbi:MAG TPA: RodZ domain-containing protein [Streptosporangiaceae bacterium]|nr:RodZ domain-containing protein [Streptosporangiaceae bacterium]